MLFIAGGRLTNRDTVLPDIFSTSNRFGNLLAWDYKYESTIAMSVTAANIRTYASSSVEISVKQTFVNRQ